MVKSFSDAKFVLFFHLCKSVFFITKHSQARNSLFLGALRDGVIFLYRNPTCKFTKCCISVTYHFFTHTLQPVQPNHFGPSESEQYQAVGGNELKFLNQSFLFRQIKNYRLFPTLFCYQKSRNVRTV